MQRRDVVALLGTLLLWSGARLRGAWAAPIPQVQAPSVAAVADILFPGGDGLPAASGLGLHERLLAMADLQPRFFFPRTIALAAFAVTMILFCSEALAGLPPIRPGSGSSSANASSWVAGGHAGYNWQQGAAVFGFATDLQATQLRTSVNAPLTYPPQNFFVLPTDLANTTSLVDWYGTLRGQLGVASGPWLLYGTAGFAYGHASLNTLYRTAGLSLTGQISDVKTGWTAGAGFKYMVLPNLSVGFQYLYVDLGSIGLTGSTPAGPVSLLFNSNANNRFQTATVGLSWHFLPGSTAAPWQGAFAGIHGGGAWGNDTNATYTGTGAQGL